jgi:hypothetical protein
MIRFNFFQVYGAFTRVDEGYYIVNQPKFAEAYSALSTLILTIQGYGDSARATEVIAQKGLIDRQFQKDLDRLKSKNIPVDVVFEQGVDVLGL